MSKLEELREAVRYFEDERNQYRVTLEQPYHPLDTLLSHAKLSIAVGEALPPPKEVKYFCVCDCIPCKTGNCANCDLDKETSGQFAKGSLCKEADDSDYVNSYNQALSDCQAFFANFLERVPEIIEKCTTEHEKLHNSTECGMCPEGKKVLATALRREMERR